ncbi:cytoskeleton-associated protein 4 [Alligator mississippiensis]|uniref:Cytoskeleton-associated protein 4 n=1 Tax=Alligator mississippiensis TaxID=8496 RepID=A0A151NHZ8_ALLMI|nr:cytoskeleton-associated protein 4 [Alligator mississippiensis]
MGHHASAAQREQLARSLQGLAQQVQSIQATVGDFESVMKIGQQKQEVTEKTVKQGENEINRISEVLEKLQNEILKDLSDGIHMVKDSRERDFTSLENTVEERLTELTKSINDNIAVFTEVQKRSQNEISDMKTKVASMEEKDAYKHELKVLKDALDDVQASMKTKEKDIELLRSTIDSMESDVYTEVKELVNLKQEHEKFKEAADTEHLSLKALQEKVLKAEESLTQFPDEIKRLDEDLLHIKANLKQDVNELPENIPEILEKNQERQEEHENKLASLEEGITALRGTSGADTSSISDALRSLSESQISLFNDIDELRRSVDTDLKMVRTAVDSLVAYSVKIETNENTLESMKTTIDDLRNDLERLFVKVEKIHEKI